MLGELIGWIGSIILILSVWYMQPWRRWPFLLLCVGEWTWAGSAVCSGSPSLFVIGVVFGSIALYKWARWHEDD